MPSRIRWFLALVFPVLLTHSQGANEGWKRFLHQADRDYAAASALSERADAEKDEARLQEGSLRHYQLVLRAFPALPADTLRYRIHFRIGELQHYFDRTDSAFLSYAEALRVQQAARLPDSLRFRPLLYSGLIEYQRNHFDSALALFDQAEAIQRKSPVPLSESERLYNLQGVLHYERGDYHQARNYFRTALDRLSPVHPYYTDLAVNYKINLAQIHFQLEDYDEANRILLELRREVTGNNAAIVNQSLGLINLSLGAPRPALRYFHSVRFASNRQILLYNHIGEAHFQMKRYDSAQHYFNLASDLHRQLGPNTDHTAYGRVLKNLGELHAARGEARAALPYYQQALLQFYPAFRDTSALSNPKAFSGLFSYINLFKTLVSKAEALHLLYEAEGNRTWGEEELKAWRSAFELARYVARSYTSDEAQLFLGRIKYLVHGKPIDLAYTLWRQTGQKAYLDDLYFFDQQNKASVLARRQEWEGGSDTIRQRERSLRAAITRLSLLAARQTDSLALAGLSDQIRTTEIQLEQWRKEHGSTEAGTALPSLGDLQAMLDEKTALLSFHLSSRTLTRMLVTRDSASARQTPLPAGFDDRIAEYCQKISQGESAANGTWLYELLLTGLPPQTERLILIPDDELHFLSFESLRNEEGKFLIETCSIQYQYAATLLRKESGDLRGHRTLAFAPFSRKGWSADGRQFAALPRSAGELQGLSGTAYHDDAATKDRFLQTYHGYPVLHLATHAAAGGEGAPSYIAFARDPEALDSSLLYAEEIQHLDLSGTKLVLLSACETGTGELVRGEGVMSLSRAFAYAGCSNIVTSLWKANDFSTAYLLQRVHRYLDEGASVDQALRGAKLDYLADRSINPRLKHPHHWAHLVFVGNYRPAKERSWPLWWLVLPAGLALGFLIYWLRKRR